MAEREGKMKAFNGMTKQEGVAALKAIESQAVPVARAVFVAMAFVETIRPVVEGYQREILTAIKPKMAKHWVEDHGMEQRIITDPTDTHYMEDGDFDEYIEGCHREALKHGFKVPEKGSCPLLIAEHNLTKAQQLLIEVMEPITGIKHSDLFHHGMDDYNHYIDLTLRWLAPKCK